MGGQLRWEGDFQMGKSKTSGSPKRENTLAKNIPLLRGGEMKWGLIYLKESFNQKRVSDLFVLF